MIHTYRIKQNITLVMVLVLGFVLMSCDFLSEDIITDSFNDLNEPNDSAQEATEVALGTNIQASIQASGDKDYYTFLVPETLSDEGYVIGTLSPFPGEPYLTFYNEQKQAYGSEYNYSTTDGADLSGWITVIPGKRYYVRVNEFSSNSKSDDPYTLNLQYYPVEDPYEPNNRIEDATAAELDVVYQSYLFKAEPNDSKEIRDYFKITVPTDGNIKVSLTSFPTNLNPQFWVLAADGEPISSYNYSTTEGADLIKTIEDIQAGVIYISVGIFSSSGSKSGGSGNEVPDNMTDMYSFQVSME